MTEEAVEFSEDATVKTPIEVCSDRSRNTRNIDYARITRKSLALTELGYDSDAASNRATAGLSPVKQM